MLTSLGLVGEVKINDHKRKSIAGRFDSRLEIEKNPIVFSGIAFKELNL
jgi:hypothetical protein